MTSGIHTQLRHLVVDHWYIAVPDTLTKVYIKSVIAANDGMGQQICFAELQVMYVGSRYCSPHILAQAVSISF